ncbi:ABC transporter substrate-binding protein [Acetobacteraceae bacterium H6797]|nr:ABC transporter substrate-binding protein [Acetobacteraceae bacterium H6797]
MHLSARAATLAAVSALALSAATANAQQNNANLTFAVGAAPTSLDPHFHQLSPNTAVAQMLFSSLVQTDANARVQPGLAESWRAVDANTWEFKLRQGVKFHNGSDFTAEDVAFSFTRSANVPNSPSSYAIYTRSMKNVEIVDPYTIRITTDGPYPLMPLDMTQLMIIDKQTNEGLNTEDYNSGKGAIGTGPFRLVSHRMGDRTELERNPNYWGPAPAWSRVSYRYITNDSARTAALLAGDVDIIDQVPTSDIEKLRKDARVALSEITGLRLIYLHFDHLRADSSPFITDNDGKPLARNPLKDERVRRALSIAIDRTAITQRIMEGSANPTGQFLSQGAFGYVPGLDAPKVDIEQAKKLLADAGYPGGFRITLHGPNDRYPNDARIIQAIGQMWTRIGVRTAVEGLPWATYAQRGSRQDFSVSLWGWGISTGEGSNPLRNLVATWDAKLGYGASNRGRYSNPQVDALIGQLVKELDDGKREALIQEATRVVFNDTGIAPIHIQKNIWAMRRGFSHIPRADELSRAQDVSPAR